ncbi:MAG: response regulator [Deltaproteobacteria bacterium]|nr:response regulator [Deltaproteobacteria bacterium]MBN2672323.1 response regulator [Deltaproteobacteria bacterium]
MKDKILLVDDEPNVLSGYKRGLRQRFDVYTAEGGEKGLEAVQSHGPFAVIVADMRMPLMDGVQFLKKVKRIAPDSTRMMLTGNADQETAMQAVNVGAIFRFLTKPCPSNELTAALTLGVRQYKLVTAEKEVLEQTLAGSIKILTDLLSISEPALLAKAEKICDYVKLVCAPLGIENGWELEMAAMLAPLGTLTQPPELREKLSAGEKLSEKETEAVFEIPLISSRLLANIPRLETVSQLVKVAAGMALDSTEGIPMETQTREMKVLKILSNFVEMELRGMQETDAFGVIRTRCHIYDLELAQQIQQILEDGKLGQGLENMVVLEVRVKNLLNGDVLKQNVESLDDRLLLSKGTKITEVYLARLNNYRRLVGIQEPIQIFRKVIS